MQRLIPSLVAAFAALLLIGGCSRSREPVKISETDSGSTVVLRSGQTLQVVLVSNPTTGYRWQLTLPPDAPLRGDGDAHYEPDPHGAGIVGAGGHETWTFHAERAGNVALHCEYRRPFETGLPPGQVVDFQISVR
jgi:inhibitor of cysteine peptidase